MENQIKDKVLAGVAFPIGINQIDLRWFSSLPGGYKEGFSSHGAINSHCPSELFVPSNTFTSTFDLSKTKLFCQF